MICHKFWSYLAHLQFSIIAKFFWQDFYAKTQAFGKYWTWNMSCLFFFHPGFFIMAFPYRLESPTIFRMILFTLLVESSSIGTESGQPTCNCYFFVSHQKSTQQLFSCLKKKKTWLGKVLWCGSQLWFFSFLLLSLTEVVYTHSSETNNSIRFITKNSRTSTIFFFPERAVMFISSG